MRNTPYCPHSTIQGKKPCVEGPGGSHYEFSSWGNTVGAARLANEAYLCGYTDAKEDVRIALGIPTH